MSHDEHLQPLVERFGAAAVWQASIETLGHPPTWNVGTESLVRILTYLEKG